MSILLEFSMFPTDKGESVSDQVSRVIEMIRESGLPYKLTAMGTIIETESMEQALSVVQKAYDLLSEDAGRIYSSIKIDARSGKTNRLSGKVESIQGRIGDVNT